MSQTLVDPTSRKKPKFIALAAELKIDRMHAWGLATGLWCFCWEHGILDARLQGWTPQAIADELYWKGDAKKLVDAFLLVGVLCSPSCRHGTQTILTVHDWALQQGPLVRKLKADRERRREEADETPPEEKPEIGPQQEATRQILQQMRLSKIPGAAAQKREHVEAWKARGIPGGKILEVVTNNPGKNVFELEKMLVGKPNGEAPFKAVPHKEKCPHKDKGDPYEVLNGDTVAECKSCGQLVVLKSEVPPE